jgi:hypothetical protein
MVQLPRNPKTTGSQRRAKQGELFDPDELRRRLEAYLEEQKLQAERRRERAGVQKQSVYHHIPRVAAADFARTATPEIMGHGDPGKQHVHKLGHIALKHHVDRVNIETLIPGTSPLDLRYTQAIDQARMQRDLVGDRNQFQRTKNLEDAAEYDRERNLYKAPQRTFGSDPFHVAQRDTGIRPLSTGDVPWEGEIDTPSTIFHARTKPKTFPVHTANDRQDWAQRDEAAVGTYRSVKQRVNPFLRRPDSIWMLKTRKEQNPLVSTTEPDHIASEVDAKRKKNHFLRRFMR